MAASIDKIVVVTRPTALDELVERHSTRAQARFYVRARAVAALAEPRVSQSGNIDPIDVDELRDIEDAAFAEYQGAHDAYQAALSSLRRALPAEPRAQFIDREFLPTFTFGPDDLVVTVGPDGLLVNTAKYLQGQPLLALNPDRTRIDGVLVSFDISHAAGALRQALRGELQTRSVSMAQAALDDGQRLLALNDLFIGQRSHISARYRLRFRSREENQSSSGVIVSTGAGSTGWLRSILAGASGIVEAFTGEGTARAARNSYRFDWEADELYFSVREPFESNVSSASLVFGRIEAGEKLQIESQMPQDGVVFSDGIQEDRLEFNSGAIAAVGLADQKVNLLVP